jgi:hypothetical protein
MHTLGGKDSGYEHKVAHLKLQLMILCLLLSFVGPFFLVITLSWNHMLQSVIAGVNGSLPWQPTPHFRDSTLGRTSDRPRSWWDRLRVTWSNFQLTNTQVSSICCINWTLKPQILDPNTWVSLFTWKCGGKTKTFMNYIHNCNQLMFKKKVDFKILFLYKYVIVK